jgi:hypothetical protein
VRRWRVEARDEREGSAVANAHRLRALHHVPAASKYAALQPQAAFSWAIRGMHQHTRSHQLEEKLDPILDEMVREGLVTVEKVRVWRWAPGG